MFFIDDRERERDRGTERNKSGASHTRPDWGLNPQHFDVQEYIPTN